MAPVLLVRHAHAGDRSRWDAPDDLRPLSAKGREQARGLALLLSQHPVERILTSPAVRCAQTVEPLARALGLPAETCRALAEGAAEADALGVLAGLGPGAAVLCTHGDVIPTLLDALAHRDGLDLPDGYPCAKGSTWVLQRDEGLRVVGARYLPAPRPASGTPSGLA